MTLTFRQSIYKFLCLSLGLLPLSFANAFFVNVTDTLAGDEAAMQVSGLTANEAVSATLERPNQAALNFTLQANDQGIVNDQLYGLHLKESGNYALQVSRAGTEVLTARDEFSVFAGHPSRYRSSIVSSVSTLPADGVALSPFMVQVQDAYGNPVSNQTVQVFSSRNKDVLNVSGKTDSNGLARGTVYSTEPGVSVLSALVADKMLFERTELVFHLPAGSLGNVGQSGFGRFLKAQLFTDDFEEIAYFSIEGLPSEVVTEQGYTFQVIAKDTKGNVVKNYGGKVRFSSDDNGVQLPIDYQFTETDQGEHEFAVAVSFKTPGARTLTVTSVDDSSVQGQVQLDVVNKHNVVEPPIGDGLTILSPTEGTFSSPRMTITGRGASGVAIKITDGPLTLVEDLSLDINGDFFYQTPALADGRHIFRAELMDGSAFSNVVEVRIDNTPPRVLAVEVDPSDGVGAGGVFRVSVSSNEALSTATCTFNGVPNVLNRSGDIFVGDIVAGSECGTFPLGCRVSDILGNELQENAAANVKVCGTAVVEKDTDEDGLSDIAETTTADEDADGVPDWLESNLIDSTGNGVVDQKDPNNDTDRGGKGNLTEKTAGTNPLNPEDDAADTNLAPTAVSSLNAKPGEAQITLLWSPAKDDQAIASYKILFGEEPDKLYGVNITPDNRTQWYIDKLAPASKYFFRVIAVDNDGNEGTASNIVEATTFGEVLHSAAVPESGAEQNMWIPIILALLGGIAFLVFGRKRM